MIKIFRVLKSQCPALLFIGFFSLFAPIFSVNVIAQSESPPTVKNSNRSDKDDQSPSIGEMVVKQQIGRRKKEHDELLKRGEEVLRLSEELENSFSANESFSNQDIAKLQSLEKAVSKIRNDLGGDDDDDAEFFDDQDNNEKSALKNIASAFRYLRESTKKLVDELKRTSRFSISAAAIQTSNAVIRLARFLRLKQ